MHDTVKKLRMYTRHPMMGGNVSVQQLLLDQAADEIEQLRAAVRRVVEWHEIETAPLRKMELDDLRSMLPAKTI